jgi:hypothetical protein
MQVSVEQESPNVIKVRLAGRVTAQEWHTALKDVAKLLTQEARASILLAAEGFEGWEPGNWDDLSFQKENDDRIGRIAIVADQKWKDQVLMFAGQGLRKVDIRFFTPPETAQARQWVVSSA